LTRGAFFDNFYLLFRADFTVTKGKTMNDLGDFGSYGEIIKEWEGNLLFGVIIDDSPYLRDLVRQAVEIKHEYQGEAIEKIARLAGHNLASTWTFNDEGLECGSEDFPETMSEYDQQRWHIGRRSADQLDKTPEIDSEEELLSLSTQLDYRVGDCATYSLTLAILLASANVPQKVELVAKHPHIFITIDKGEKFIDLARRSHGKIEEDMFEEMKKDYRDEDSITITF